MDESTVKRSIEASKAYGLADLAAYQEGSVVSREIVRGKAGTVTVFAFDEGQGLSEHTAPFDAIVNVLDGAAEITIEGEKYSVATGQVIVMPAHRPHAVFAAKKFKMLLILVKA